MKYIINSIIEFDTTEYVLTSLNDSSLSIKLSNSAGRILEELIKHRYDECPVTRKHLFTVVWQAHGLEPSNGNLNQQISLIRKTLSALGLDASCIITIPKRGLKLSNQLIIENIQDNFLSNNHLSSHIIDQNSSLSHSMILSMKTYIKYIFTLTTMLIIMFSIGFMYLYHKSDHMKFFCCKELNTCNTCTVPTKSESENYDDNLPYFEIT